jgi:predicted O-linked N-acetylglucosamine transferase (SPINDLY family)
LRPLGDLVEARAHAEEAVRLAPELNSGWRTLGAVWLHMGDARRASDCFYRALQLDPALPDAWSEWLFALQYRDDISADDIMEATRLWSRSQPSAVPGARPSAIQRIGLVSGDFRAHPVGRMMLAFVPALRALGVDVVLIANQSQMDGVTEQLQDAASAWHNVWALPTEPEGTEATATEALLRLPNVFTCDSRAPQSVPAGPRDHVVFGSFNNLAKLSDTTIALWSAVLAGISDSRMILKYRGLGDPALADALVARFESNGIEASRIECRDWTEEAEVNAAFADVDIMLDTFPYSGATTTLDALQRGVPVVTLVSDRYAGRMSAAFLSAYGAEDLITSTPEDYVECAVHLALDGARRQQLREELPRRGATSSVHQPQQFATEWLATVQSLAQERAA